MKNIRIIFWCVRITIIGLWGRGDLCVDQNDHFQSRRQCVHGVHAGHEIPYIYVMLRTGCDL